MALVLVLKFEVKLIMQFTFSQLDNIGVYEIAVFCYSVAL